MATKHTKTEAAQAAEEVQNQAAVSADLNKVNPLELIAIADADFSLLEKTLAAIDGAKKNGAVITADQQAALQARYASLRDRTDGQFSGDHWALPPPAGVESPVNANNL